MAKELHRGINLGNYQFSQDFLDSFGGIYEIPQWYEAPIDDGIKATDWTTLGNGTVPYEMVRHYETSPIKWINHFAKTDLYYRAHLCSKVLMDIVKLVEKDNCYNGKAEFIVIAGRGHWLTSTLSHVCRLYGYQVKIPCTVYIGDETEPKMRLRDEPRDIFANQIYYRNPTDKNLAIARTQWEGFIHFIQDKEWGMDQSIEEYDWHLDDYVRGHRKEEAA